jgi:hypothetical protein
MEKEKILDFNELKNKKILKNKEIDKNIDTFIKRLLEEGVIKDPDNIPEDVANRILNAVELDGILQKVKKSKRK